MIEKLLNYKGVEKLPNDFKEFWDNELKTLEIIDPHVVLKENTDYEFKGFDCFDLFFDSIGDTQLYAKCVVNSEMKQKGKLPVLLLFHGYGGNSGGFYDKLAFASQGYVVVALDVRGQYGKSGDNIVYRGMTHSGFVVRGLIDFNPQKLYFHHAFLDSSQLVRALDALDFADTNNIYVFGGSMGGALAAVTAALNPDKVKKAFIGQPFLCDIKYLEHCSDFPAVYSDLKAFLRTYARDEMSMKKTWDTLSYIDVKNFGQYIKAKVLFYVSMSDTTCYPDTQFALYNSIESEKWLKCYNYYGHEDLPGAVDEAIMFFNK